MIKKTLKQAWSNHTLAHAYLLIGPIEIIKQELSDFWQTAINNFSLSPDKTELHFDSLGVAESRLLKASQTGRPLTNDYRFFVISFDNITIAAQNALLKVLEEPAGQTIFFILTPTVEKLLPTVISRCQIIKQLSSKIDGSQIKLAGEFIESNFNQRLDLIEKNFNPQATESRLAWHEFLNTLEIKTKSSAVEKIWQNRRWLDLPSFPLSFATIHLAMSLPVMLK
jgi:hypothetical protein